jgi:MYXO-CTERM domain-containing protein
MRVPGVVLLLAAAAVAAQTPQRLGDLNTTPASGAGDCYFTVGATTYFIGNGPEGQELWRTDSTPGSTRQVADINPDGLALVDCPRALGTTVLMAADDGVHGTELWRSDGTAAGTVMVKDIAPGAGSGVSAFGAVVVRNVMVFTGNDGVHGTEPWVTDGTAAGTGLLVDIEPGAAGSSTFFYGSATALGLFFGVQRANGAMQVWVTDGTPAGTHLVTEICTGTCKTFPVDFVPIGGGAVFTAGSTYAGVPWFTDGTAAGTVPLATTTTMFSDPFYTVVSSSLAVFVFDDGTHGSELWKTDGTAAGTALVADLAPGFADSRPTGLVPFGGRVVFAATDGSGVDTVYVSDGTTVGTQIVRAMGPHNAMFTPSLGRMGAQVLFTWAPDPITIELWQTDGTAAGTSLIVAEPVPSLALVWFDLSALPFFIGYDAAHGLELWRTDGTAAGTQLWCDVNPATIGSAGNEIGVFQTGVAFAATSSDAGNQLWLSDGTPAGTRMLAQPWQTYPFGFTQAGQTLFFSAETASKTTTLWMTDGRDAGPVPGVRPDIYPDSKAALGGALLFSSDDGTDEIWRTDGTSAGTVRLAAACPMEPMMETTVAGAYGYFRGDDCAGGRELWKTDGTPAGTGLFADLIPGPFESYPEGLTASGGLLYFITEDSPFGDELWRVDGTDSGTIVFDLNPDGGSYPWSFVPFGDGGLYFNAAADGLHEQVWATDGTLAGTHSLTSFPAGAHPDPVALLGDRLILLASDPVNGRQLWRLDDAGVQPVAAIWPDAGLFGTVKFVQAGTVVYFAANDRVHGDELWRSDGTAEGSWLVADISPGPRSSSPQHLVVSGGRVFFFADDGLTGAEPWALTLRTGAPAILRITSPAQQIVAGACSAPLTIEARDDFGALAAGSGVRVRATSASPTTAFFSDAQCATPALSVPLDGAGAATLFFSDATPGPPVLTVSAMGARGASQTETIETCTDCRVTLPEQQVQASCAEPITFTPAIARVPRGPYLAAGLPEGLTVDPQTGQLRWTPTAGQAGDWTVQLSATGADQKVTLSVSCTRRQLAAGCGCDSTEAAVALLALVLLGLHRRPRGRA